MGSNQQPEPARLRSVKNTAQRLGMSANSVWALLKAGELPHVRILSRVLVDEVDLDKFIMAHRQTELREGARR